MKKKILFAGHPYHQKTKSSEFLIDYLGSFYDVELVVNESWDRNALTDFKKISHEYFAVIFWQLIPPENILNQIDNDNIIYFPMYDESKKWTYTDWLPYKNIKIFNFSKALHKQLTEWGFNCRYLQYFVEPKKFVSGNKNEVFFWQRRGNINLQTLATIFKKENVKIHLHKVLDPKQVFKEPSKEIEERFKLTYSMWFDTKEEMQKLIESKTFYVAPRELEGIGMSFLEAMAMGKAVIANDKPTMNEYIKHGVTGYLCDFRRPVPIDFKNLEQVQKSAYEFVSQGYAKWLVDRNDIIEFIKAPNKEYKINPFKQLLIMLRYERILRCKFGRNPYLYIFGFPIIKKKGQEK